MSASFSGVFRGTDQRVETCLQVSRESDPSRTDGDGRSCGSHVKAQASARVDVPTAPHYVAVRTKESNSCVQVFQENAWICARPTTHRDLESQRHEKVNAWIWARPTTHHDLESVIPDKKKEREREREREREMQLCNCRKNFADLWFQ